MTKQAARELDLHDIQGNIVKGYGRFGFPFGRYVFFQLHEVRAGRKFVLCLLPLITTSEPWRRGNPDNPADKTPPRIPEVTTNTAFTFEGLRQLGLPDASLYSFPDEFTMGMRARQTILGDDGVSAPDHWDPIWRSETYGQPVHMIVMINGKTAGDVGRRYDEILNLVKKCDEAGTGIEQLQGNRGDQGDDEPYQSVSSVFVDGKPSAKEHFGYVDGIGDPYFKGSGTSPKDMIGGGKPTRMDPATKEGWEPLETGEFLLGHRDEADEYPQAPIPRLLADNGTYLVYRKLHENVASFFRFLDAEGAKYPDGKEALAAKFAGRWRNGAPITTFPTEAEANEFIENLNNAQQAFYALLDRRDAGEPSDEAAIDRAAATYYELKLKLTAFDYNHDLDGSRCPLGAHMRRANPRSSLEFGNKGAFDTPGALVNRRRIARRGSPYGAVSDPPTDDGNHGVIIMFLCADIGRQFEFVQQQWINYGNDFRLANDKDPLLGNHEPKGGRMVFPGDEKHKPYFCSGISRFVETRGGDYFFIPSLTALRMIGDGSVDPT